MPKKNKSYQFSVALLVSGLWWLCEFCHLLAPQLEKVIWICVELETVFAILSRKEKANQNHLEPDDAMELANKTNVTVLSSHTYDNVWATDSTAFVA